MMSEAELLAELNDLLPRIVDIRLEFQQLERELRDVVQPGRPELTVVGNPERVGDQ